MPAANRDQARNWNKISGPSWVALQEVMDRMLEPFVEVLLAQALTGEGDRVLDIGCGSGATTLAIARRVGAEGFAMGIDISAPLVAAARGRAQAEHVQTAAFIEADAQTFRFDAGEFDAAISRFGVMFFDDPETAFANIRRAVRRGGKLALVAWRGPGENPLMTAAVRGALPFLPDLPRAQPDAPGPFGLADGERTRRLLSAAGWRDVAVEPLDLPGLASEADVRAYVTGMGPVGAALRDMEEVRRREVTDAIWATLSPLSEGRTFRVANACWLVTARA